MITNNHNDGVCFKTTIVYTDYEEADPFEPQIYYGEDYNECIREFIRRQDLLERDGRFVLSLKIEDDSK